HRKTRGAIERALARGLGVRAAIVVLNDNVDGVDATVAELESLGVTTVTTSASRSAGRGNAFTWQAHPSADDATAAVHRRAGALRDGKLAVTYDGHVVPCIFNRRRILGSIDGSTRLRDVIAKLAVAPDASVGADTLSCASCRTTDLALALLGAR